MNQRHANGALFRLSLRQQIRGRRWFLGVALFGAIVVGTEIWKQSGKAMFGDALMLMAIVAMHFGLADDVRTGFDSSALNFFGPVRYLASKVAAAITMLVLAYFIALVPAVLLWGSFQLALWHLLQSFLIVLMMVPLGLLIEVGLGFAIPLALSALLLAVALFMSVMRSAQSGGGILKLTGLDAKAGSFHGLSGLVLFDLTWGLLPLLGVASIWWFKYLRPLSDLRGRPSN
jgi:hypothetical protein